MVLPLLARLRKVNFQVMVEHHNVSYKKVLDQRNEQSWTSFFPGIEKLVPRTVYHPILKGFKVKLAVVIDKPQNTVNTQGPELQELNLNFLYVKVLFRMSIGCLIPWHHEKNKDLQL